MKKYLFAIAMVLSLSMNADAAAQWTLLKTIETQSKPFLTLQPLLVIPSTPIQTAGMSASMLMTTWMALWNRCSALWTEKPSRV